MVSGWNGLTKSVVGRLVSNTPYDDDDDDDDVGEVVLTGKSSVENDEI
jgi:hypothetical protein